MNDLDIRLALISYLQRQHASEPDLLIVEEVNVRQGLSRVDLAVVGESLHGYEIKSQRDTLKRLASQMDDYRCVFERISVVSGLKHLTGILRELPTWCGILLAHWSQGEVVIEPFRDAQLNLHRDPYALAQLLWRAEALAVLERHGCAAGVRSKARAALWDRLAESLSLHDLGREVKLCLSARKSDWRAVTRRRSRRRRGGGRPRRVA
jgi:hypothetical protein